MDGGRRLGVLLVLGSAVAFGALGVLADVAFDEGGEPIAVLAARFSLAAALLLATRLRAAASRPAPRQLAGLAAMGACYVAQSLCYLVAVRRTGPGLAALLLYLFPAIVCLASAALLRERLGPLRAGAVAVATAGTALLVGARLDGSAAGVAAGLGAAVLYSGYVLGGSRVLRGVEPVWGATCVSATAGLLLVGLTAVTGADGPRTGRGWSAVVGIALLCTVVALLAFLAGLQRVGAADAATLSTLEPVSAVALAALVSGEPITRLTLVGGALVLASVVVLGRTSPPQEAEAVAAAEGR